MTLVRERELVIPALRVAAGCPNGVVSTTALIEALEQEFQPEGRDSQIADGRNDSYFSQKVRNIVSHRGSAHSMFSKGYAVYLPAAESMQITDAGRAFLDQVPVE
jgi:hypothetical protein